jgi:hypothetical protein
VTLRTLCWEAQRMRHPENLVQKPKASLKVGHPPPGKSNSKATNHLKGGPPARFAFGFQTHTLEETSVLDFVAIEFNSVGTGHTNLIPVEEVQEVS